MVNVHFCLNLASDRYIKKQTDDLFELSESEQDFQRYQAFYGLELTRTRRDSSRDYDETANSDRRDGGFNRVVRIRGLAFYFGFWDCELAILSILY